MVLGKEEILKAIEDGLIVVEGKHFNPENQINENSIDVRLAPTLLVYKNPILDCKQIYKESDCEKIIIHETGYTLTPGEVYLGVTHEYTEAIGYYPKLIGKSSLGRLGLFPEISAGSGEDGFRGHWTLELTCIKPIVIYPYMPIAQIVYAQATSIAKVGYSERKNQKGFSYANSYCENPIPVPSTMGKNFL